MKTNVQVKDEPVELQVNELLRLYGYNLTNQSSIKPIRTTKTSLNQEQEPSTCAWCQKLGVRSFTLRTDSDDSKTLCSEVCFNQYRRASFKKNKGADTDMDHSTSSTSSTLRNRIDFNSKKSSEKRNGTNKYENPVNDVNRRKIIYPQRRPTPVITKTIKTSVNDKKPSSSPLSSSLKRQRLSSSSSSSSATSPSNAKSHQVDQTPLTVHPNLPVNLAWQSPLVLPPSVSWSSTVDVNRFQYPLFIPPPPPPPPLPPPAAPLLPLPSMTSTNSSSSTLFQTLSKGTLSNYTCILPTFIPLPIPIPIPLCFNLQNSSHRKYSTEVNNQQCQTFNDNNLHQKRTRRLSV